MPDRWMTAFFLEDNTPTPSADNAALATMGPSPPAAHTTPTQQGEDNAPYAPEGRR
jgi:hypothetical protein